MRDYLEPDLISSTARYWGRFAQARYAEAFEVVRDRGAIRSEPARDAHEAGRPRSPSAAGSEDPHTIA